MTSKCLLHEPPGPHPLSGTATWTNDHGLLPPSPNTHSALQQTCNRYCRWRPPCTWPRHPCKSPLQTVNSKRSSPPRGRAKATTGQSLRGSRRRPPSAEAVGAPGVLGSAIPSGAGERSRFGTWKHARAHLEARARAPGSTGARTCSALSRRCAQPSAPVSSAAGQCTTVSKARRRAA